MEGLEVCFVPKPKVPGRFLVRLRGEGAANLSQADIVALLGGVEKSAAKAKDRVRKSPYVAKEFIEVPQIH